MAAAFYQVLIWTFPKIGGTLFGGPFEGILFYLGYTRGPPILVNTHMCEGIRVISWYPGIASHSHSGFRVFFSPLGPSCCSQHENMSGELTRDMSQKYVQAIASQLTSPDESPMPRTLKHLGAPIQPDLWLSFAGFEESVGFGTQP